VNPASLCLALSALPHPWKKQPSEKGFLFGYPMLLKKRDGIIVIAETVAGG